MNAPDDSPTTRSKSAGDDPPDPVEIVYRPGDRPTSAVGVALLLYHWVWLMVSAIGAIIFLAMAAVTLISGETLSSSRSGHSVWQQLYFACINTMIGVVLLFAARRQYRKMHEALRR